MAQLRIMHARQTIRLLHQQQKKQLYFELVKVEGIVNMAQTIYEDCKNQRNPQPQGYRSRFKNYMNEAQGLLIELIGLISDQIIQINRWMKESIVYDSKATLKFNNLRKMLIFKQKGVIIRDNPFLLLFLIKQNIYFNVQFEIVNKKGKGDSLEFGNVYYSGNIKFCQILQFQDEYSPFKSNNSDNGEQSYTQEIIQIYQYMPKELIDQFFKELQQIVPQIKPKLCKCISEHTMVHTSDMQWLTLLSLIIQIQPVFGILHPLIVMQLIKQQLEKLKIQFNDELIFKRRKIK